MKEAVALVIFLLLEMLLCLLGLLGYNGMYNKKGPTLTHPSNPLLSFPLLPFPDVGRPVPNIMQMVMVQLQPLLDSFNYSLEHLSRHVAELARNMDLMMSRQQGVELQVTPLDSSARDEVVQVVEKETEKETETEKEKETEMEMENVHTSLEQVLEQVMDIHWQMKNQRTQVENRLHSQHVMLHYNLTSFKTDVDAKLKRHHKMLQVKKKKIVSIKNSEKT